MFKFVVRNICVDEPFGVILCVLDGYVYCCARFEVSLGRWRNVGSIFNMIFETNN